MCTPHCTIFSELGARLSKSVRHTRCPSGSLTKVVGEPTHQREAGRPDAGGVKGKDGGVSGVWRMPGRNTPRRYTKQLHAILPSR